jgi:D-beta-D-heptose 7-phosphate kinase/D-beta-D-heptose 1-phosphate adenosyltransferase
MRFLVIGDACHDIYHFGTIKRLNPESSAPLLTVHKTDIRGGMAYNVAANLRAFGVETVVELPKIGSSFKTRYVDEKTGYQFLRVDDDRDPDRKYKDMCDHDPADFDAVVVSDYNKGFLTENDIATLSRFKHCFIDTKKRNLGGLGPAWFKINAAEEAALISRPTNLVVTLGADGARHNSTTVAPGFPVDVVDVCGAGDTFLAAFAFAMTSGCNVPTSMNFANRCAAITCTKIGTYALKSHEVPTL